jgi:alpha-D-xyloside xylohydrolase
MVGTPVAQTRAPERTPHGAPPGFDRVASLTGWSPCEDGLTLHARSGTGRAVSLFLRALAAPAWQIVLTIPDADPEPQTPIRTDSATNALQPLTAREQDGALHVGAPGNPLTVVIQRDPWQMAFIDAGGRAVCRENPSDVDGLGRPFVLPLGFVADAEAPLVTQSLHLAPDEHLFGLGEKFTPLDKRGQRIISWTQDAFGSTSERSHKNVPFVLSTRGYGLLVDSGARITWELGTQSCQSWTMAVEGPTLDMIVIAGATPAQILERYTALTGRSPLPPPWSFGLWLSGGGTYRDQAAMSALMNGAEQRDMPFDVLHIDTWWMRWRRYMDYRFDETQFPALDAFIADVHARGLKLSAWSQPYISIESPLYAEGAAGGHFLTDAHGEPLIIDYGLSLAPRPDGIIRPATPENAWNAPVAIVDLTRPETVRWFQDHMRPVLRRGVDVFKTDFGEDVPAQARAADGQTGRTLHNRYPLLYNRAVCEVVEQEKGWPLVWSRAGTAGSQRYPVCWSGDPAADWDSLACTIRGGLSLGMSGVPFWSSDIGGYRGMPSPDLYVRWAQFTLFCSHARMHGDSPREPWHFGDEADAIVRRYVALRYRWFPYFYHAAHEAVETGLPVIRAMALAFPDDPTALHLDLQYMLGDAALVAPVYTADGRRSVYLPAGRWFDDHTGAALDGPQHLTLDVPLDRLPLYVKAGTALAHMPVSRRIPSALADVPLEWRVFPGDGLTTLRGMGAPITVTCTQIDAHTQQVDWHGMGARRFSFATPDPTGTPTVLSGNSGSVRLANRLDGAS